MNTIKSNINIWDKEEWLQEMRTNAVRGVFDRIEDLGCDVYAEFKNHIFKELDEFSTQSGISFIMPVIYAFGEK